MTDSAAELLDRVGAFVAESGTSLIAAALAAAILILFFWWTSRLFERFRSAGKERMGIYVVGSLQSWFFLLAFTLSVWLELGLGLITLDEAQSRLWLNAPYQHGAMVLWSAGLAIALGAIAFVFSEIEDALKIPPTRFSVLMLPRTTRETAIWSLVVSPTAGFCEEVLFRGLLISTLTNLTDDLWLSVALSSALFGLVHAAYGPLNVLATGAMGVVLALGFVYTGSLWPSIVAHTLYDMAVPFLARIDDTPGMPAVTAATDGS